MKNLALFTWENLTIWATGFVILSLMIERGLYQIFQTKAWAFLEETLDQKGDYFDLKPWVSILVSVVVAVSLDLDLPAFLFDQNVETWRMVLTGLLLSGGSTSIYWMLSRGRDIKAAAHGAKLKKINEVNEVTVHVN